MNKRQIRSALRSLHQGAAARRTQSAALCRHILESEEYKRAQVIGGYIPLPHEAEVLPVLLDALRQEKTLALPRCEAAPRMTMRRVGSLEELTVGAYGIPEPAENTEVVPIQEIDLLLVPLEGIDKSGVRLGKGGGYYDCLLADGQVFTVGCALSWQWVESLPCDVWDKPLSACADAAGLHYFVQDRT